MENSQILFVGGFSRSGSTLLDRMLGQCESCVSTGELDRIWSYGVVENNKCGCGKNFSNCPYWHEIMGKVLVSADWMTEAIDHEKLRRSVRIRQMPKLLLQSYFRVPEDSSSAKLVKLYRKTYRAIGEVFSASIIVDSSKSPLIPFILTRYSNLNVHVIHIVRDPRAVVFSMLRKRPSLERSDGAQREIQRLGVLSTLWRWVTWNSMFELLSLFGAKVIRIRYEDLVGSPIQTIKEIERFIGRTLQGFDVNKLESGTIYLQLCHNVAGNPMRFTIGDVKIQPDNEWKRIMSFRRYLLVTALTFPLLVAYKYKIKSSDEHLEERSGV